MKIIIKKCLIFFIYSGICISQTNWFQVYNTYNTQYKQIYFLNENTGFLTGNGVKLWRTINGGINWVDINPASQIIANIDFININTGYFCSGSVDPLNSHSYEVFKTTNSGLNWVRLYQYYSDAGIYHHYPSAIKFIDENIGMMTFWGYDYNTYSRLGLIKKTTNGGVNWFNIDSSRISYFSLTYSNNNAMASGYFSGSNITDTGYIKYTSNNGLNWVDVYKKPRSGIFSLQQMDLNRFYACGFNASNGPYFGTFFFTTNTGINWSETYYGNNLNYNDVHFLNNNTGWMCGDNGIILKTFNSGLNWYEQASGLENSLVTICFINETTGYCAGINTFLLKTTNGGGEPIGLHSNMQEIPNQYSLSQNYPNPFNPSTKIKFRIPASESVAQTFLYVYDILGREVATLVNQQLQPGTYEVNWNASDYPSGVYFYKLSVGDYSETKRMVLLK